MNAMWIPVGSAVAIILLSLGVLEVMSERVRVDQSSTAVWRFWETPAHSGSAFLDAPDDLLTLELGPTVGREPPETMHGADGDDRDLRVITEGTSPD
jgi:hypothetical protein